MTRELPSRSAYDEVLYPAYVFDKTHPSWIAALAILWGMSPARIETCRVLDLGCNNGTNILAMAEALPEASFHGIDHASKPVEQARSWVEQLGLRNVTFECRDFRDVELAPQSFDYILVHGVFSWVTPDVRQKILALCSHALAPNGIAFIHYITYPGDYETRMAREMMRIHVRHVPDPAQRVAQAKDFMRRLVEAATPNTAHQKNIERYSKSIASSRDEYFFHDDLADFDQAIYFNEFMEQAASYGLAYLSEADRSHAGQSKYAAKLRDLLGEESNLEERDLIEREQHLDFLLGRGIRQTLLCRKEIALNRTPARASVCALYALATFQPQSRFPDVCSRAPERFTNFQGRELTLRSPFCKTAKMILYEAMPRALSFTELLSAVRTAIGTESVEEEDAEKLENFLLAAFNGEMLKLYTSRPTVVVEPGERPCARPIARLQAARGAPVTTSWHADVTLHDPLARYLLTLLDGEHDRALLLEKVVQFAAARKDSDALDDEPSASAERPRLNACYIESMLNMLAQRALLIG